MQSPPKLAITLTTINDGRFLDRFRPLLAAGGNRLALVIAGDRKTPPECASRAARLVAEGFDVRYLGLDEQADILDAAGLASQFVPFDSDNRRNLAVLEAWRSGADVFISLDDDNFPLDPHEFISCYSEVGKMRRLPVARGAGRWPNVCALLDIRSGWTDQPVSVFARGHPHARRDGQSIDLSIYPEEQATVLAHVGLWEGHPDVDAATRAALDPISRAMLHPAVMLASDHARAPMSTQNIAVARELVPAWWYVRMGRLASGRPLDRFGDMFQAYFASMVIDAVGARFAFGLPLVRHERNAHSLLRDLTGEVSGMALLEDLLTYIETVPAATSVVQAYRAIADGLVDALPNGGGILGDDALRWADETAQSMLNWTDACERLNMR